MNFDLVTSKDADGNPLDSPETLSYTATLEEGILTIVRNVEGQENLNITEVTSQGWESVSEAVTWFTEVTASHRE
jgi:hypothetical protein